MLPISFVITNELWTTRKETCSCISLCYKCVSDLISELEMYIYRKKIDWVRFWVIFDSDILRKWLKSWYPSFIINTSLFYSSLPTRAMLKHFDSKTAIHNQFPEGNRVHGSRLINLTKGILRTVVVTACILEQYNSCLVQKLSRKKSSAPEHGTLIASREDKGCFRQENGEWLSRSFIGELLMDYRPVLLFTTVLYNGFLKLNHHWVVNNREFVF